MAARVQSINSLTKAMACLLVMNMLLLLQVLLLVPDLPCMDVTAPLVLNMVVVELHKLLKPHKVLEEAMLSEDRTTLSAATQVIKARADIILNQESSKVRLMT